MRRRYRWDPDTKEMVEISWDSRQESLSPTVWNDLPAYESPIDGRPVEGRRQRRNDLARTGCRPYEGREQESREAAKVRAEHERKLDLRVEESVHRTWHEMPEAVRRTLRNRSG